PSSASSSAAGWSSRSPPEWSALGEHDQHGALGDTDEAAFVADLDAHDGRAFGERDDLGLGGERAAGDGRQEVELELCGRRPRTLRDDRIADRAEGVVDGGR